MTTTLAGHVAKAAGHGLGSARARAASGSGPTLAPVRMTISEERRPS